jgi:hypothetical protein
MEYINMTLTLFITFQKLTTMKSFTSNSYVMNPNTIREFAASFQKSRILLSGDIFTNLDESGTTNNQIANNLHLDEHSCERLLNALASLGFFTKQNQLFFNTWWHHIKKSESESGVVRRVNTLALFSQDSLSHSL